ncbi:signal transduction protein containing a membrane domain an EAL and a GGDEF domain [Thioalkalivibrio sulfidiphilus HL-EbGr7]|uniref:Signal transduction protein containing a membrane domain an EAL and a GGDEF domain n=1 Tax=Thioalkalivibrio sulfidiphilus (strain HL-EbGR7) TaxID=396588 RepID=B8GSV3_THISH|nr:EAL domain-containing protein [Thioalkalivibrio sulfidiphilus]ACL71138.1 signal transduction protein containing a membrane domain an EAL and a GGDEF domain [Thioalkalivibrio sulfidiphilus HL-EbGr7]
MKDNQVQLAERPHSPVFAARSRSTILVGFGIVLCLMAIMIVLGLSRMAHVQDRLERIVHEHNVKTELLGNMRNAARERSVTLLRLAITTDPFDLDAGIMDFRQEASQFMVNRGRLTQMSLSAREEALLEDSRGLTVRAVQAQEAVLEHILNGEAEHANRVLLEQAIPLQNAVLANLDALLALQREAGETMVEEAAARYRSAVILMSLLGLAALLLGALVGRTVGLRTARVEADLYREKERAQVTLHAIGDAVITTDTQGLVDYLNPVAEHLTGWRNHLARGRSLAEVFRTFHEGSGDPVPHPLIHAVPDATASSLHQGVVLVSRDGREFAVEEVSAPIRDRDGHVIGAALVFRDVTQAREMARKLSWAATHDSLTGLVNRAEFERRLDLLVTTARQEGRGHAVLFMDLDQFKLVNDTCGHAAGDELLRQLTRRLQGQLRDNDTLARLGGDEFGVLLEGCPMERAGQIAETLRATVAEFRFQWQEKIYTVGVCIGVAPIDEHIKSVASLMSDADAACYLAKEQGRNRIHIIQHGDQALSRRQGEMSWVQRINEALERDRFCLYHQHIVPVSGNEPPHTEVLVRMLDEDGAIIAPMAFIPAAERYGLMPAIDRWVIARVLNHLRIPGPRPHGLYAINLSGQSLCDNQMLDFILDMLARTGVEPGRVCFEITETTAIANLTQAERFMSALRNLGCRFALDDFGTGMSSFGYLKQLKVDFLKIDGSFVRDMNEDPINRAMVESINHIGHIMGIQTIAECVAHEAVMDHLKAIGVNYGQGFGLHMPAPLEPAALPGRADNVIPLSTKKAGA